MVERLKGIIDMHIHSAPDIRERKLNDLELMEAAVERGVRAIVIKSHFVPTADRAYLINQIRKEKYPDFDFEMFGGIALNQSVGGINPKAVEAALKLGAKVVWLPTSTASNHFKKNGKEGGVYKKNLPENVETIKRVGADHIIVSTDSGQLQNPEWYKSIEEYADYLYDAGFEKEEIDTMMKKNPAKMLGIC